MRFLQNKTLQSAVLWKLKLEREGEFDLISRRAHSKLRQIVTNVLTELVSIFLVWRSETCFLTTNAEYYRMKLIFYGESRDCTVVLVNNFCDIWCFLEEPL